MAAKAFSVPLSQQEVPVLPVPSSEASSSSPSPSASPSHRQAPSSPLLFKILLQSGRDKHERRALHLVYFATIGATPPKLCTNIWKIVEGLERTENFDVRMAIAALDRRHVLRFVDDGDFWVSIRPDNLLVEIQSLVQEIRSLFPEARS